MTSSLQRTHELRKIQKSKISTFHRVSSGQQVNNSIRVVNDETKLEIICWVRNQTYLYYDTLMNGAEQII